MDIRQLQRFIAVVEQGSINKAAQVLAVSQPSLSRSIAQLEQAIGTSLFERGPGGIAITPAGEEMLVHARVILSERARALAALQRLGGAEGETIAIGTDAAFAMHRLPRAIAAMAGGYPKVQFRVVEVAMKDMLGQLREGRLSLVLGSRAPFADLQDLQFEALTAESASVALRSDHPLMASGQPALKDLVGARWIVPDYPSVIEGWEQLFLQADLPVPPIALRTSSLQMTRACLLEGDYVSVSDHTPYADEVAAGRLVFIDMGFPRYQRPAGLFRRQSVRLTRAERALIALLREACA